MKKTLNRRERRAQGLENFQPQYNGKVFTYEEAVEVKLVKSHKFNKYQ